MTSAIRTAQRRIGEQSTQMRQLAAELDRLRADLEAATAARDTAQVFAEDYSRDLGIACADLRALREQHDAVAAERDQLRSLTQGQASEIELLNRKLRADTEAHAQAAARLADLDAEVEELRIEVQKAYMDGPRRGRFGRARGQGGRPGTSSVLSRPSPVDAVGPVEPVDDALTRRLSGEFPQ